MIAIDPNKASALTLAKAKKNIEAVRDGKLADGVMFNGKLYQTDPAFQVHISGIVTAINAGIIPPGAMVQIRTKGNTIEELTTAQVVGLAGTVLAYVQGVFAESWAAKDAL